MSNFGNAGAARAAAAVMGTGPYKARFGLTFDGNGVASGPADGVSGYAHPTVTAAVSGNVVTIDSSISLGTFSADLGAIRAVSLHDAGGGCIAAGWLADQIYFGNGGTAAFAAGAIVLTLV